MRVTVAFARSETLGGRLIRLGTMSDCNHVAIAVEGRWFEAQFQKGVVETTQEEFSLAWNLKEEFTVLLPRPEATVEFLQAQLGKKYDWAAVLAMPFRGSWQWPNRWFCSELVAAALEAGGFEFAFKPNRVTPRDLLVVLGSSRHSCPLLP